MSFKTMELDQFTGFGQRLMMVARLRGYGDSTKLAKAIYTNDDYRKKVIIRKVSNSSKKNNPGMYGEEDKIRRLVQKHFSCTNVNQVPHQYLEVYSELLDCSMDYLYEKTKVISSDLSIADICNKTGLTEEAVNNLCSEKNIDVKIAWWWSELLSGESFFEFPLSWMKYAERIVQLKDMDKKIQAIDKASEKMEEDNFLRFIEEGNAETIRKIKREKEDAAFGAFHIMMMALEEGLSSFAEEWANNQHRDYSEMYYKSEINKVKIIETALK